MTRARTTRPGTVRFVGGGPGNAGMLTCRAQEVLTGNPLVFADADVSADVLALVATEVPVPQELLDARRAEMDAAVAMVARVPSADFWAHSEPEQVTVTDTSGQVLSAPGTGISAAAGDARDLLERLAADDWDERDWDERDWDDEPGGSVR